MIRKFFLFASFFLSIFFLISIFAGRIFATGEFSTSYNVNYEVDREGKMYVSQEITLKNQTTNFYATEFSLKLGATKVENVQASDNLENLETRVNSEGNATVINVKLNQKIVGIGKSQNFKIGYDAPELAEKKGQILEVSIPKVGGEAIETYNLNLIVPQNFGPVAFISPKPLSQKDTGFGRDRKSIFFFDLEKLSKSGVSASFGKSQIYDLKLNYIIKNPNLSPAVTEISLPPQNHYQDVFIEKIDPRPLDVSVDQDGNWLARYRVGGRAKLEVKVSAKVSVFPKPKENNVIKLTEEQKRLYTQAQKFWDSEDSWIHDKAQSLNSAREIYDFVISFLSYSEDRLRENRLERLGAVSAYKKPKDAVCMEFTDLFIALARAKGIPAREINGFAYTQNERLRPLSLRIFEGDVLHAWPEFFDEKLGWVQVDPTWASTSGGLDFFEKLDFNHITFVQKGLNPESPLPAGAFKLDRNKKTVFAEFAQRLPKEDRELLLLAQFPKTVTSGVPFNGTLIIENKGNTPVKASLTLDTGGLTILQKGNVDLSILPPFARREINLKLEEKDFFKKDKKTITAFLDGKILSQTILVEPFFLLRFYQTFFSIFIFSFLISLAFFYRKKLAKLRLKLAFKKTQFPKTKPPSNLKT